MRSVAIAAAALAALVLTAPAKAEDANIETVVVSRSADDVLNFRIAFAEPVRLDGETTVQVAIDADRDTGTGIDGLDYSLDWSGSALLITAVGGEPEVSDPASLGFEHQGAVITFSIAASEIGSPERFDFYTFIEQDGHTDIAPVHVLFSAAWTYPEDDVPAGGPYPTETYEDLTDVSLSEGNWGEIGLILLGVLAFGAVVTLAGLSIERHRKRRRQQRAA